jgi:hypothetical protein
LRRAGPATGTGWSRPARSWRSGIPRCWRSPAGAPWDAGRRLTWGSRGIRPLKRSVDGLREGVAQCGILLGTTVERPPACVDGELDQLIAGGAAVAAEVRDPSLLKPRRNSLGDPIRVQVLIPRMTAPPRRRQPLVAVPIDPSNVRGIGTSEPAGCLSGTRWGWGRIAPARASFMVTGRNGGSSKIVKEE